MCENQDSLDRGVCQLKNTPFLGILQTVMTIGLFICRVVVQTLGTADKMTVSTKTRLSMVITRNRGPLFANIRTGYRNKADPRVTRAMVVREESSPSMCLFASM
jgi:hypothetical protein